MGSVFRPKTYRPIPRAAEVVVTKGRRVARWRDGRGKLRTAPLNKAGTKVVLQSAVYFARYRDGTGRVQTESTGCRDKSAAESKLHDLARHAERVRVGVITPTEA